MTLPKKNPDRASAAIVALDDIIIGERHRKHLNNIESLARSIEAVGLLHPVVIDRKHRLIAGERRIRALQLLGRKQIPATVVDLAEIVHGEYVENTEREDFTLSEAVAIKRAIEPLIKAEAAKRQAEGGRLKAEASAKLAGAKGEARDIIASAPAKGARRWRRPRRSSKHWRPNRTTRRSPSWSRRWITAGASTARSSA